jgi:hypothetical protein
MAKMVPTLRRSGHGLKLRAQLEGEMARFEGGKFGPAEILAYDMKRVLTHREGYCEANGLGVKGGTEVSVFFFGWKVAKVLKTTPRYATVEGVYKGNGRRWESRISLTDAIILG